MPAGPAFGGGEGLILVLPGQQLGVRISNLVQCGCTVAGWTVLGGGEGLAGKWKNKD